MNVSFDWMLLIFITLKDIELLKFIENVLIITSILIRESFVFKVFTVILPTSNWVPSTVSPLIIANSGSLSLIVIDSLLL